jgi:hypothetical protein
MKSKHLIWACIITFIVSEFASATDHSPRTDNGHDLILVGEQQLYQRRETITYTWNSYGVEVSFYRQDHDLLWTMAVRGSQSIMYEVLSAQGGKTWGLSDSKCSMQECLRIIDQSLKEFHAERPSAKLESVDVEMQIIKDLWAEISGGLHKRLLTLSGDKSPGRFDVPHEIEATVQEVVVKSPTTAAIRTLLQKYGMDMGVIAMSEHVMFKDSLTGRKWSDIANEAGIGILAPGTIEYGVIKSKQKSPQKH